MSKKNLIVVAIMSLILVSAGAVFGQPTKQKGKSLKQPNSTTRTKSSVFDRFGDRDPPEALNRRSGRQPRNMQGGAQDTPPVNNVKGSANRKNIPGGNNLSKTGTGTLDIDLLGNKNPEPNRLNNKNPELNRSRVPRRTGSGIIIANTEGDVHVKGKTRRPR